MPAFHVQKLDSGYFVDLAGGADFHDEHAARRAAEGFAESSGIRARIIDDHNKTVWDSKFALLHQVLENDLAPEGA